MNVFSPDRIQQVSQRRAARIAGFTLLLLIVSGFTGMLVTGSHLIVDGDAAATAGNVAQHETRFRLGLACEIVMLNCDFVLALAFYALLKPVHRTLALLGSFWRIGNATLLMVAVAGSLVSLDMISNVQFMSLLAPTQLHALALILFNLHDRLSLLGLLFFCLGAGVHSWLLYRSRYIPRIISGLYLFSCMEMLLCCFALVIFPKQASFLDPAFVAPDVVAELAAAIWLAWKGITLPEVA